MRDRVEPHPRRSRRGAVAAHRVERDGDVVRHAPSGSISRPLYVLHVGHIRCARRRRSALRADSCQGRPAAARPGGDACRGGTLRSSSWERPWRLSGGVADGLGAEERSGNSGRVHENASVKALREGRARRSQRLVAVRDVSAGRTVRRPAVGHRPAQSSRQHTSGSARSARPCAQRSRSSSSPSR